MERNYRITMEPGSWLDSNWRVDLIQGGYYTEFIGTALSKSSAQRLARKHAKNQRTSKRVQYEYIVRD